MVKTIYANVVNVRLSGQEMVLEFGSLFPETPPAPGRAVDFDPEVRVVMTLSGLKPYVEALQSALKALEQAQAQNTVPQPNQGQAASK